jgi:hypothetical protein
MGASFFVLSQFCNILIQMNDNDDNIATDLNYYSEGSEKSREIQENDLSSQ